MPRPINDNFFGDALGKVEVRRASQAVRSGVVARIRAIIASGRVTQGRAGTVAHPIMAADKGSQVVVRSVELRHNKRLEQAPRVESEMILLPARRCSAAIR